MKIFDDSPKWVPLALVLFIAGVVLTVLVSSARAGTAYRPVYFPDDEGLFGVKIISYKNNVAYDTIPSDSIATFPFTGNVVIDDGNHWRLAYWKFWEPAGADSSYAGDEIVWGWTSSTPAGVPGGSYVCRVYGTARGADGDSLEYAKVVFTAPKGNCSCDSTIMVTKTVEGPPTERSGGANWKGYFQADLVWSSCLGDKKYDIEIITNEGERIKGVPFTVPDSTTYKLYW